MSKINIRLDDKLEAILRHDANVLHMSLSEYIRQRLFNSTKSESEQIFSDYINELKSQKAELIQLRKEFRLIVGALLQALDECNMSPQKVKQLAAEFFQKDSDYK
mgnify:CR=1 FL=1